MQMSSQVRAIRKIPTLSLTILPFNFVGNTVRIKLLGKKANDLVPTYLMDVRRGGNDRTALQQCSVSDTRTIS